jgi:hypothetical protein
VDINTTAEWPVPVDLRQSRQEQTSIERTGPLIRTLTAPQAQLAVSSRFSFGIGESWHEHAHNASVNLGSAIVAIAAGRHY